MRQDLKAPAWLLTGTLLIQLAWIWAVPPFRGMDEFDHAYRAASVADGYWNPDFSPPEDGRGGLIPVPRRLVDDARETCSAYRYTGPDNCRAVKRLGGGLVAVASAASQYNPVFYWVVGTPARWATGSEALYVMRLVSALVCALMVALAAWTIGRWSRTRWPLLALLVAVTPVTLYSSVIPAPNGVEMAVATSLWVALLGLATPLGRSRSARSLLLVSAASAAALAGVRTLGPLWLALILLATLASAGLQPLRMVVRDNPKWAAASSVLVTTAVVAGLLWTINARPNSIELHIRPDAAGHMDSTYAGPWGAAAGQLPVWLFQSIAAFPGRIDAAPTVVYAAAALPFLTLLAAAFAVARARTRLVLLLCALLSVAIPGAITVLTYHVAGVTWQGRYTLPFAFGIVLLAGYILDRANLRTRREGPLVVAGLMCLAVAHMVSTVSVLDRELVINPLSGDPRWMVAPAWLVGLVTLAGVVAWGAAVVHHPTHGRFQPETITQAATNPLPAPGIARAPESGASAGLGRRT